MRNWQEEGTDLERALVNAGVLLEYPNRSLLEMVNQYGLTIPGYKPLERVTFNAPTLEQVFGIKEKPNFSEVIDQIDVLPFEPNLVKEPEIKLSNDQQVAWDKLQRWVIADAPYFALKGYAGSGKTFLLQMLNKLNYTVHYSAPTNKATKVLSNAVGMSGKTTYSMLGLRMEQQDDKLILTPSKSPPYFPRNSILVIDEASMCGRELCKVIDETRSRCRIKILLVGDPAQLPPVGEAKSSAWNYAEKEWRVLLQQIMRFDNQLLALSLKLRECLKQKHWQTPLKSDHDANEGIWKWKNQDQFIRNLLAKIQEPDDLVDMKVLAWRNKTVDQYNGLIRNHLGFKDVFCRNDLISLAAPIEKDGTIIAHTDEEFKVTKIVESVVHTCEGKIPVWQLHVSGDSELILDVAKNEYDLNALLTDLANTAKFEFDKQKRKIAWSTFWETKNLFHKVRYSYAMTVHRSQGSTYKHVHADQSDILTNRDKREAFRCLYVAATRAGVRLDSF